MENEGFKAAEISAPSGRRQKIRLLFWMVQDRKEYSSIMWARMNGFCKELGFAHECAKGDFIPEPLFYRLGMKANNTVADKFQN